MILDPEDDDDEIEVLVRDVPDNFNIRLDNVITKESTELKIFGIDNNFRRETRKLLEKFSNLFSTKIGKEPAKIPPFELIVDKELWEKSENRTPPRPQSIAKDTALSKWCIESLENGLILPSTSAQWSHPHLEPKKEKEVYRICCDFKNLNRATKKYTWPLPNIQAMLTKNRSAY